MKYSEMLDFEINCAVAELVGKHADYCNSWADAGPIILANRIGLTPSVDIWHAYSDDEDSLCSIANPLRAAMTVFLMMQEASNA